jgi:hypothetical protein
MNCQQCRQLFDEALIARALPGVRKEFDDHLTQCQACAKSFVEERRLWELLGAAPSLDPSHGFIDRLLRRLDEKTEPVRPGWLFRLSPTRWAIGTAVVVIGIVVGSLVLLDQDRLYLGIGNRRAASEVKHFEELFTVVENVDPDSVMNGPLYENGSGEAL